MTRIRLIGLLAVISAASMALVYAAGEGGDPASDRAAARKLMKDGNWKEAYEAFSGLALDPKDDPAQVGDDLNAAVQCLQQINRTNECDDFRERVIKAHADNWRLLQAAALSYFNDNYHFGYIVAGQFERGYHRGGGRVVNSYERDRTRALQLMAQAMDKLGKQAGRDVGQFYWHLANMLMGNRGFAEAWRLQYLTDLKELPDYEEGWYGRYGYYGHNSSGAPVDADGNPIYYHLPKGWDAAANDGERWRWALMAASEADASQTGAVRYHFAQFLLNQFGVQTMNSYGWFFGRSAQPDPDRKDESGTWALHTLGEDETIAKLATGIRRFKLPDEFNFVKIFQQLADERNLGKGEDALTQLASIFENRRQYPKAADYWQRNIKEYGPGSNNWKKERLAQIVGNWGLFEPIVTQPAGEGAAVDFRFRNGKAVHFTASEIDVRKLLDDVKAYLNKKPQQLDWKQTNIEQIGYRLVQDNQKQYVVKQVAEWDLDLKPLPDHFDRRITVTTPLQKAGAYLLTGQMADGNVSRIILWVADTAIVAKPMADMRYFFVADAVSGEPIAKANLELFGYWQEWVPPANRAGRGTYNLHIRDFAEFTDADGQAFVKPQEKDNYYQWVTIATTEDGRLAYDGFQGAWYGQTYDPEYNQVKTFVITDRPVYRPSQKVQFKFWVNRAKYDATGKSDFAGQSFLVRINDPRGEKVFEKEFKADDFGGFVGEFDVPEVPVLGSYQVYLPNAPGGGSSFRVEEYKKPEFEVSVEAPADPVMLGEKIAAKVKAKYYFGAPVVNAKVSYKVLRYDHNATWYPFAPWDWFYGRGYWWFAYDYVWYPGWREWGCPRPVVIWWGWRPQPQPEVVAQGEARIGADGTLEVPIDTAVAKAIYPDRDHRYEITAEVTDESRRTITGTGKVLVARHPFKVYAWVDRGYYRVGDVIHASFKAQRLDEKPVEGQGELTLYSVSYKDGQPVEAAVQNWKLPTDKEGCSDLQFKADKAGQYRLSYKVTDAKGHAIEGGYVLVIRGAGFDGGQFRFNDLELIADKAQYAPGDKVSLMVNTNRAGSTVVFFARPTNGVYLKPKVLRLAGKTATETLDVAQKDMPNFFVEAFTVSGGKVYTQPLQIVVPPESRVLNIAVEPSKTEYKPGEKATVKVRLTDPDGKPVVASTVLSIYDKAVEYISGGSNVPDIKEFFWKWQRHHYPRAATNLDRGCGNLLRNGERGMGFLGVFGATVADEEEALAAGDRKNENRRMQQQGQAGEGGGAAPPAPSAAGPGNADAFGADRLRDGALREESDKAAAKPGAEGDPGSAQQAVQPTVRSNFADTALWVGALTTNDKGEAEVSLTMPENLSTWKTKAWAMGDGARCGEGSAEVVTTKNLIVRLQAPRFFVQKDEVVLSANVHNYLKSKKDVKVELTLEGGTLELLPDNKLEQAVQIDAGGEKRVDWRVRVLKPGDASITVKALTDEESDAMRMSFPVLVHGILKTESWSGVIRPDGKDASLKFRVPAERRPEQSRLEIRYSPTLAGAMIDALPYLAEYPYGCTEQTLNRFLPTVITQKVLLNMGVDLAKVKDQRTNLNAQEIGDDPQRLADWKRLSGKMRWDGKAWVPRNPVFDADEVTRMVKAGLEALTSMQNSDGGWGWFSGWGEQSWPHTTAVVVHGLQLAAANDVAIVPGVLDRGVTWLVNYQAEQLRRLKLPKDAPWHKDRADDLDGLVYMVLVDAKKDNKEMRAFLYRDRNDLSVYAKSMLALACHKVGDVEKGDMFRRNVEQFLVQDDENQSAWLNLGPGNRWWCWYGSEIEAMAYYVKLLAAVDPKSEVAPRMVKYLLNNRRHATYWNSTRDTAVVVEAFADYLKATGEDKPDMTVRIALDGKQVKEVKISAENLFSYDNKLVLIGDAVTTGEHQVAVTREGKGPVYFNAYLTNFTMEDPITAAGLEVKVQRQYYRLVPVDKSVKNAGSRGQAVDMKVEKYERQPLKDLSELTSGQLVEIELVLESKNDYEYLMFEDPKPAGFEPVEVRSGYNNNDMGAYMELRDQKVTFFVRALARGKHSVSYRMRAEIPGRFSALPTQASAMYAPELKANSDEIKLKVKD
ncbi:MAG: hypothetical protein BIFFINMI_01372 [Phycisphaerae bacterium]|nr:hypothetical protein [Phycisphaerae bacterium]